MTENRCPLIENCQQKSAVCNVQLPDETCYWFRWFRALDNPWHTGTPTEEGWYLQRIKSKNNITYDTDYYENGDWKYSCIFREIVAWQKIEEKEEK